MIFSRNWLVEPVVLRRASSKAALLGSAVSVAIVVVSISQGITVSFAHLVIARRLRYGMGAMLETVNDSIWS